MAGGKQRAPQALQGGATVPGRGRPRIERDEKTAEQVRRMAQVGLSQDDIATVVGISKHTLLALYADDIGKGAAEARAAIGNRLFAKAVTEGDTASLIFLAKTRLGMRETSRAEIEVTQGQRRLQDMSDDELLQIVERGRK